MPVRWGVRDGFEVRSTRANIPSPFERDLYIKCQSEAAWGDITDVAWGMAAKKRSQEQLPNT